MNRVIAHIACVMFCFAASMNYLTATASEIQFYEAENLIYSVSSNSILCEEMTYEDGIQGLKIAPDLEKGGYEGQSVKFYLDLRETATYKIYINLQVLAGSCQLKLYVGGNSNYNMNRWFYAGSGYTQYQVNSSGVSIESYNSTLRLEYATGIGSVLIDSFKIEKQDETDDANYRFIGDKGLTDYTATASITVGQSSTGGNKASLMVRAMDHAVYGKSYYAASLVDGTRLSLEKSYRDTVSTLKTIDIGNYADGVARKITVSVFNEEILVYLDDVLRIEYNDLSSTPNLVGGVGTYIDGSDIVISSITIHELVDTLYGGYDNYFGRDIRNCDGAPEQDDTAAVPEPEFHYLNTMKVTDGVVEQTDISAYKHVSDDITVYCSFNSSARPQSGTNVVLMSEDPGSGNTGWSVELTYPMEVVFKIGSIGGSTRSLSTPVGLYSTNTNCTFLFTYDSESLTSKIYRSDKGLVAQTTFTESIRVTPNVGGLDVPLTFGRTSASNSAKANFNGWITDVRIYGSSLNDKQIAALIDTPVYKSNYKVNGITAQTADANNGTLAFAGITSGEIGNAEYLTVSFNIVSNSTATNNVLAKLYRDDAGNIVGGWSLDTTQASINEQSAPSIRFYNRSKAYTFQTSEYPWDTGVPTHVTLVYVRTFSDTFNLYLYKNGQYLGGIAVKNADNIGCNAPLTIGADSYSRILSDISIFHRALTAEEIRKLYKKDMFRPEISAVNFKEAGNSTSEKVIESIGIRKYFDVNQDQDNVLVVLYKNKAIYKVKILPVNKTAQEMSALNGELIVDIAHGFAIPKDEDISGKVFLWRGLESGKPIAVPQIINME